MISGASRRSRRAVSLTAWLACGLSLWVASPALARPDAPMRVCATYPDAIMCQGRLPTCTMCHTSTFPAAWNTFGVALFPGIAGDWDNKLASALMRVEGDDSDGDGVSNLDELRQGTWPGDAASVWRPLQPLAGAPNPQYTPEAYDEAFALRRVKLTFCGESPSFEEIQSLRALPDAAARREAIHAQLAACLDGPFWREVALPRLADWRIRPVLAVGEASPVGIRLADYTWDYNLFVYVLTGDRDLRELLTATYHVRRTADGGFERVEGAQPRSGGMGPQPLDPSRRAGMITTQWFLMINTMFSGLPRTTAAQAYRAYLGADISRYEGIMPTAGEPRDVDRKGVKQEECASCHSTLDPLSYAFAPYAGIQGSRTGDFIATRPAQVIADWTGQEQGRVLGEPVDDVVAWASRASGSDAFRRAMALMLFEHVLQRAPRPGPEAQAFAALWQTMPEDGYSANRLLHRLIDTPAFGAP